MSVNPASVSGVACGSIINITYIATVAIAPDSNAGTVTLVWNAVFQHPAASITFAPTQTLGTITLTLPEKAAHYGGFPRPVSIASTSPNAFSSAPIVPSGQCA
jgi:hypothetical protein